MRKSWYRKDVFWVLLPGRGGTNLKRNRGGNLDIVNNERLPSIIPTVPMPHRWDPIAIMCFLYLNHTRVCDLADMRWNQNAHEDTCMEEKY